MRRAHLRALVVVLLALTPPARASTLRALSDAELVAASDALALAEVEETHAVRAGGRIQTIATLRVETPVKGCAAGERLVVRVPGGAVGRWAQAVEGAPVLRPGERTVVFLERAGGGQYRFVGLEQGKLDVVPDPDLPGGLRVDRRLTARRVERAPDGTLREVTSAPPSEPLPDLLARLEALAGGAR